MGQKRPDTGEIHSSAKWDERVVSDSAYAMMFSALFLILGGFIAWHHEMWRDEMQAWLIARDSASPLEVLYHLNRYDGHPGFWHLCLFMLKLVTRSPIIMQLFHLIIATISVYVFLRFSPFTRLQKSLFVFGYLPFYEYAIICRNYAFGVLLLFLFCTIFKNWKARFPLLGFILLLLAHTSVHALIIVISIGIALCWELICTADRPNRMKIGVGFSLILFGIVTAIIQLKPSGRDPGIFPGWNTEFELNHFLEVVSIVPKSFFPIPQFRLHFWNSFLLDQVPLAYEVKLALAILVLIFALVLFVRKPTVFMMYLVGTIGLLALFYTKRFGFIRHWGFLFMLFLVAIWVFHYCRDLPMIEWKVMKHILIFLNKASLGLGRSLNAVLTSLLIVHLIAGFAAAAMDYKYPFSSGKTAARFLKESRFDGMIIASEVPDDVTLEILGYLEEDQFYYPRTRRFGSFILWDQKWAIGREFHTEDVLQEIQRLSNAKGEDILVISGRVYPEEVRSRHALTKVKVFAPSVIHERLENYVLYRLRPSAGSDPRIDPETVVGMWCFDEGKGNVVQDSSGHGSNGILVGAPEWVDGKFGTALRFDGVGDYVDCGSPEILRIRQGTMVTWIQIHTTDDSGLSAVSLPFDDTAAWGPPWRSLGLGTLAGDAVFGIAVNGESKEFSSGYLTVGQWHHLAITYDGVNRKGYLDGDEVFSYISRGEITYSGAPSCVIGVNSKDAPGEFFNGFIDEVAIFNIPLTGDGIRLMMKNGLGRLGKVK